MDRGTTTVSFLEDDRPVLEHQPAVDPKRQWLGTGEEILDITTVGRRRRVGELSGYAVELRGDQPRRRCPLGGASRGIVLRDHPAKDRGGQCAASRARCDHLRLVEA